MPTYADFVTRYPQYDKTHDIDELRARNTAGWTSWTRSTWITPAADCTPPRRSGNIKRSCCATSSATRTRPTRPRWRPPGWSRAPASTCCAISTPRPTNTLSSSPRTPAGRSNWSARPIRSARLPLPAHFRQPQLGQRHSRVRPGPGRRGDLHPAGAARPARRRGDARRHPGPGTGRERGKTVRLPGPVELLLGPASPGVDRKGPCQGLDVLLDAAAFVPTNRLDLDKYKPDFVPLSFYKMFGYPTAWGADRPPGGAGQAAAPLVRRGDDHRRLGPGRQALPGGGSGALRGRHGQLPEHPGHRDRG